jgi:hypothetical protein
MSSAAAATATAEVAIALLVILCIGVAVGRGKLLWDTSKGTKRGRPPADDRATRLNLREPRDLLIVIAAIALGAISFATLLGIKLGL